ncbi:MAG TPA: hypothetical protein VF454_04950 [Gemmatimonadales bacterium]
MTDPTPRPKRVRRSSEPEKLAPGLYGVGRFGDQHDLTDPHHKWLSHLADADLYAIEGYLRHALARAEHERLYRESDHTNRLTRALDLRDVETNLPRRQRTGDGYAFDEARPSVPTDVLERVRDGLAENLASDPDVRDVIDRSASEFEKTRDAARMGPDLGDDPDGDVEGYDGALSPEVAAKVDEALADPSTFVKRNRPRPRAQQEATAAAIGGVVVTGGLEDKLLTSANQNEAGGRPAQPWDNDAEGDPWRDVPSV